MHQDKWKETYPVLAQSEGAFLLDLGDGIAALGFAGQEDRICSETAGWAAKILKEVEEECSGVVVFGAGENLCCGNAAESAENLADISKAFQSLTTTIRHYSKPVVTLLMGQSVGFGYEIALNSHAVVASPAVTRFGYDFSQGLPPMGGGLTAPILDVYSIGDNVPGHDIIPFLKVLLNTVYVPKKYENLFEAKAKGLLPKNAAILAEGEDILEKGKQKALHLYQEGFCKTEEKLVAVSGTTGRAAMEITIVNGYEGLFVSQQMYPIALKIAGIIGGGNVPKKTFVAEKQFLELEMRAFVEMAEQKRNGGSI